MTPDDIRLMLDAEAMASRIRRIPVLADGSARLGTVVLERAWVKPGRHVHTSYRVALETDAGSSETLVAAGLVRADQSAPDIERRVVDVANGVPPEGWRPGWHVRRSTARIAHPPMLVQVFPWDYRLPTLPGALDHVAVGRELGETALGPATVAGYWPGIRCQIRYRRTDREGALYGKVFVGSEGAEVARRQEVIACRATDAGFAAPRVCSWLPTLNLLVCEPVAGEPLLGRLAQPGAETVVAGVATALAGLHGLPVPDIFRPFTARDELRVVRGWVALAGALFPELAARLAAALGALERRFPDRVGTRRALVHRDFYDKQVLVGPRAVAFLDLDTASHGDPEIDVANFCAHLVLRALQAPSTGEPATLAAAFLEAYRARRPLVAPRFEWYRSSALLRLGCLYALRPWWRQLAPELIAASCQALGA